MAAQSRDPFPHDALDTNRAGALTDAQEQHLRIVSRSLRSNARSNAGIMLVAAAIAALGAARAFPATLPLVIAAAFIAFAIFATTRLLADGNALARDLRHPVVRSTEGAIGKRRAWYRSPPVQRRQSVLDVGGEQFLVSRAVYDVAPDAGMVRVYFLPASRRIVNLERLPNPPLSVTPAPGAIAQSLLSALTSPDPRRRVNETRAELATFAVPPSPPPPATRDRQALADTILGTWSNGFMTVAFSPDGTVTATLPGGIEQRGHWSVDRSGRLRADVMGETEAADAWVAGDQLVISTEGAGLTFTRAPAS